MRLKGKLVDRASLTVAQRDQMFWLMQHYYCNMDRSQFDCDLREKQWAILLTEEDSQEVLGFSTQTLQEEMVDGRRVCALFSGDTIVHQEYWAKNPLAQTWGRFALSLIDSLQERELYWFLISKGYKTYRFLPLFFREFYPRFDAKTPHDIATTIRTLAANRFGEQFDPQQMIVRSTDDGCHLRPHVAELNEARLRDPHIAHFLKCNPRHDIGDELCCVAPLSRENFTSAAWRVIGLPAGEQHLELIVP